MKLSQIPRRYVRVATVLTIAAATGHLMQNSDAIAARLGGGAEDQIAEALAAAAPVVSTPIVQIAAMVPPAPGATRGLGLVPGADEIRPDRPMPSRLDLPGQLRVAALETPADMPAMAPGMAAAAPMAAADCTPTLETQPQAAAIVLLSLTAPCNPNAVVRIAHGGIAFKTLTDAAGAVSVAIPALQASAEFTVTLPGSVEIATRIEMPTLLGYDRVAVTWSGHAALELHAFEFGADYGQDGHVWRGNPHAVDAAIAGSGGFTMLLGDADVLGPVLTEVYTYPAGRSSRIGLVQLSLEAEVTRASCGKEIAGRSVTILGGVAPKTVDVTLAVPDCEAIGDYLVLNNLFDDLKIAAK